MTITEQNRHEHHQRHEGALGPGEPTTRTMPLANILLPPRPRVAAPRRRPALTLT
jgi:hypothetical protein